MNSWIDELRVNTINTLLSCGNPAIEYFTCRDLLEEEVGQINRLWQLPAVLKILKKQQDDGFWKYPGKIQREIRSRENYDQFETFKMLGEIWKNMVLIRIIHKYRRLLFIFSVVRVMKETFEEFMVTSTPPHTPLPSCGS